MSSSANDVRIVARSGPVLTALGVVVLSYGLLQTMLVPTVGVLQRALRTGVGPASWAVLTAPLLASVVLTPLVSRLADRCGARRVLLASLAVYLVGTVGAGLAPGIEVLIGFRAVQGIGLALVPLSFVLVRATLPAGRVPFGLALTAGLVTGSAGAGLLVGGLLADLLSWRWIFVLGSALVALALLLTVLFVPTDRPRGPSIPAGGLLSRPLVVAHAGALLLGVNQFLCYVLVPRLAQLPASAGGFGTTVTGAALILLPGTLVTIPASWAAEPLARRYRLTAPLALGLLLAGGSGVALALGHGRAWQVVLGYLACSVGYGLAMAGLPRLVNHASPAAHSGSANGANTVARVLGGAAGSQLAVLAVQLPGAGGFVTGFLLAAGAAGLGALLCRWA
ncbi:MFS transporter [Pseudonocardia acaciae]|uniref:MFS transporter n=1 Tax=Pseudonocardia acaciae TaxID=551276 RepID=UPI0009FD5089|nr:MFS transporter [Pseudonocardia acaciae]